MTLQHKSKAEYLKSLVARSVKERLPLLVSIEVSHRCPLSCSHCYNNLSMNDWSAAGRELTLDEYRRILDDLAELGCIYVLFTGGEIFARPDFLDIYTYAKRKGFIVTLFTNGTMITQRIADHLADWPPYRIEITLYGRTRETYERLTRVPGSYDRCLRGISLLHERRLPLTVKTVIVSINRHETWAMKRFIEDDLGQAFRLDAMINPRIDGSTSPLELRVSPAEVVAIDLRYEIRREEWERFAAQYTLPTHAPGDEDEVYHCGGGVNSFSIDPQGRMTICMLSQREAWNLREGTVQEGWNTFLRGVRGRKTTRVTKCSRCQIKAACGMCPANGELETGDPESPVDFLCHTAHLRAYALSLPLPAHGECEYCPGGSRHGSVLEEAARLRAEESVPSHGTSDVLSAHAGAVRTTGPSPGFGAGGLSVDNVPVSAPTENGERGLE